MVIDTQPEKLDADSADHQRSHNDSNGLCSDVQERKSQRQQRQNRRDVPRPPAPVSSPVRETRDHPEVDETGGGNSLTQPSLPPHQRHDTEQGEGGRRAVQKDRFAWTEQETRYAE